MKRSWVGVILVMGLVGAVYGGTMPSQQGIYEQIIPFHDGQLRYTLSIPAGFDGEKPVPLVMALHYAGTVTPWYGRGVLTRLVEPALHDLGAIIVAPDCPGRGWTNALGREAVTTLVEHIRQVYPVDMRRTLVTGFSMGGIGTWYMAAHLPDMFKVAIPVAGIPLPAEEMATIHGIPLRVIHSRQDEICLIGRTETAVRELQKRGVDVQLITLVGLGHYEIEKYAGTLQSLVPWIRAQWAGTH